MNVKKYIYLKKFDVHTYLIWFVGIVIITWPIYTCYKYLITNSFSSGSWATPSPLRQFFL